MKKFIAITIKQPQNEEVVLINAIIPTDRIEGVYQMGDDVVVDVYNKEDGEVQQMVTDNPIGHFVRELTSR